MSAYSDHAARCGTCSGFDSPGGRSYTVPARCAEGTKLLATPTKKATRPPSMPTPKPPKDPEPFSPNSEAPTIKVNE